MSNDKITNLVIAAQKGDDAALNDLFNATYNHIYYFALKTLKSEDLACDITQDTFVAIIDNLQSLNEPAAFMGWAKKIAYSKCTRYFNKKKDLLVEEDEDGNSIFDTVAEDKAEFIPDEALDQAEFKKTIHGILDVLSEEQRSAVMLYYFDEMSVREISEIQGVSEGTVKSRLNYARKAIKNGVEDYEKKHNIKLHAIPFFPFFGWLFDGQFQGGLPIGRATSMAESISAATGASITAVEGAAATVGASATVSASATTATVATASTAAAGAAGIGAKIAAIPLVTKIVAGVVAVALVAGGITTAVLLSDSKTKKKGSGKKGGLGSTSDSQVETTVVPNSDEDYFEDLPIDSSMPAFNEDESNDSSIEISQPTEEKVYKYTDYGVVMLDVNDGYMPLLNKYYAVAGSGDVYFEGMHVGVLPPNAIEYKHIFARRNNGGGAEMISAHMGVGSYVFLSVHSPGGTSYPVGQTLTLSGVDGNLVNICTDENVENIVRYITEKNGVFYLNHITDSGIVTTTVVFDVEVSKDEHQDFTQVEEIYSNYTYAKLNGGRIIELKFNGIAYTEIDEILTEYDALNPKYDEMEWGSNKLECADKSSYALVYNSLSDTHIYYYTLDQSVYTSSARIELPEGYTVGDIIIVKESCFEFSDGSIYAYDSRLNKWHHSETLSRLNSEGKIITYSFHVSSNSNTINGWAVMDDGALYEFFEVE